MLFNRNNTSQFECIWHSLHVHVSIDFVSPGTHIGLISADPLGQVPECSHWEVSLVKRGRGRRGEEEEKEKPAVAGNQAKKNFGHLGHQ